MSKKHHDYFLYAQDEIDAPMNRWRLFRLRGKDILSPQAQLKLEWIIFYYTIGRGKVVPTAKHFSINPKTLHKWLNRFDEKNLLSLEEHSRTPEKKRTWMVTREEEINIKYLRKKHMTLGKKKLQILYQIEFEKRISTWKIERVVRKYQLYPNKALYNHTLIHRHKNQGKKRIHQLRKETKITQFGELWHVDAVILWWYGKRRIIFTAIDETTRIAFARVYQTNSAVFATDFLKRLVVLSNGTISLIHSDNGSEFGGSFQQACLNLKIPQVYSRAYTPKDNALLERFNRTIQEEWLSFSLQGLDDIIEANRALTDWLIYYNNVRPHQALDYKTPLQYTQDNFFKVLPMWSASTIH